MNYQSIGKQYILPALGLLLLSMFSFYPQLQNKAVRSHDNVAFKAMSKEVRDYRDTSGELVWWSNSMFGGMPTYQTMSTQPGNLLAYVHRTLTLWIKGPIGLFFLIMISAYLSFLLFRLSPWVSFFGAAVIGLSTSNFVLYLAGHYTKMRTVGYSIPILIAIYLAYKRNRLAGIGLYGLALGLALLANHPQMLYYLGFSLIIFFIVLLVEAARSNQLSNFIKTSIGLAIISIVALATSASKILPTLEFTEDTMRGSPILSISADRADSKASEVEGLDWEYATNWSNSTIDVIAGFIPGAAGGASVEKAPSGSKTIENLKRKGARIADDTPIPLYWGGLGSTSGVFYFGAVLIFLVFIQFVAGKRNLSIWLALSLIIMLIMSMGRNMEWFNRLLFDYAPMFNKFRTPNSISAVIAAIMGMGATFGLHTVVTKDWTKKEVTRAILYAGGPLALISLFFAMLGPGMFDFQAASDAIYAQRGFDTNDLIADRKMLMQKDAFRSLVFVLLGSAVFYLYAVKRINKPLLIAVITALALFDGIGVGKRYLSSDNFKPIRNKATEFVKRPVDDQILQAEKNRGSYRVYDLSINTFNEAQTSYWHNTIGGYHPAKLQRFEDIKNFHLYKGNAGVLNMLNAKYIITKDQKLQSNPGALGNAWFVQNIQFVNSNDEEIQALTNLDPRQTAIVNESFRPIVEGLNPVGSGEIAMTDYKPNKIAYTSNSTSDELAVFSEVWYGPNKGWYATIDGQKAEILRVNYILRGLRVPAGNHEIIFEFDPQSQRTGEIITLLGSLLILGFIGYLIYGYFRNNPISNTVKKEEIKTQPKKRGKKKKSKK